MGLAGLAGFNLDLNNIISQGFDLGKTFLTSKYGKDAAKFGAGPYVQQGSSNYSASGVNADQLALLQQQYALQQQQQGVGFGIDGQGLRMSDGSHIGWPVMGLAALALYLLQSPGFSRRR